METALWRRRDWLCSTASRSCPPQKRWKTTRESCWQAILIPAKAATDAFHIAIAAVHRMDFLLTWNCTHIHNLSIVRRVERICTEAGYACPVICNPDELLPPSTP